MKINKKLLSLILLIVVIIAGKYVYDIHLNHNFKTITDNKVYKSGVIPPNELEDYITKYNIKSVIDLRFPGTGDLVNNPEIPAELTAEKEAIEKIANVNYFNLGTDQVPEQATVDSFLKVMDDSTNYPVLIHCYHGSGRAQLFSALYRMEYENMSNEDARSKTRVLVKWSSFDDGKPKGDYLKNYIPRNKKKK